jgi:hypothetical protein
MVVCSTKKGQEKVSSTIITGRFGKSGRCPSCSFVDVDESGGDVDLICQHSVQRGLSVGMFDSCVFYRRAELALLEEQKQRCTLLDKDVGIA